MAGDPQPPYSIAIACPPQDIDKLRRSATSPKLRSVCDNTPNNRPATNLFSTVDAQSSLSTLSHAIPQKTLPSPPTSTSPSPSPSNPSANSNTTTPISPTPSVNLCDVTPLFFIDAS
ncbi:hypothetical protein PSTG_18298, partial [Puccinia striiformis f. sp. tritici PST-78]